MAFWLNGSYLVPASEPTGSMPNRTVSVTDFGPCAKESSEMFKLGSKGESFQVKFGVHREFPWRTGTISGWMFSVNHNRRSFEVWKGYPEYCTSWWRGYTGFSVLGSCAESVVWSCWSMINRGTKWDYNQCNVIWEHLDGADKKACYAASKEQGWIVGFELRNEKCIVQEHQGKDIQTRGPIASRRSYFLNIELWSIYHLIALPLQNRKLSSEISRGGSSRLTTPRVWRSTALDTSSLLD